MARGLAAVYDPDLEAPSARDRSIRMDPALRLEASPAVVLEDANLRWVARQLTSLLLMHEALVCLAASPPVMPPASGGRECDRGTLFLPLHVVKGTKAGTPVLSRSLSTFPERIVSCMVEGYTTIRISAGYPASLALYRTSVEDMLVSSPVSVSPVSGVPHLRRCTQGLPDAAGAGRWAHPSAYCSPMATARCRFQSLCLL